MDNDQRFRDATVKLFREAFEGMESDKNYTWFVQGREGMFDTLDSADAATASIKPSPTCSSLAAHAHHLLFALRKANVCGGRPEPEGTWESSWEEQEVSPKEWEDLKADIREAYSFYRDWFATNEDWAHENGVVAVLAPLPHVAYHLGAMRQILNVVTSK